MKNREMKNNISQRRPERAPGRSGLAAPLFWKRAGRLLSCLLVLSMLLNSFAFTVEDIAVADATPMSHAIDVNGQEHAPEHAVEELQDVEIGGDDSDGADLPENTYIYDAAYATEFLFSEIAKAVMLPIEKVEDVQAITVLGSLEGQEDALQPDATEALFVEPILDENEEKTTDYAITALRFFQEAGLVVYTEEEMYTIRLVRPEDALEEMEKRAKEDQDQPADSDEIELEAEPAEDGEPTEEVAPAYEMGEGGPVLLSAVMQAVGLGIEPTEVEMVAVLGDEAADGLEPIEVEQLDGDYRITVARDFEAARLALYAGEDVYTVTLTNGVAAEPTQEVETDLPGEPGPEPTEEAAPDLPAEPTEAQPPEEADVTLPDAPTEAPADELTEAPADELTEEPIPEEVEVELTAEPTDAPTEEPVPEPTEELPQEPTTVAYPAQTFTGHTVFVRVNVSAPEGAFPEGTTMAVRPVWDNDTISDIRETVSEDFLAVKRVYAVDIAFNDADGNEIEPLLPVAVEMSVNAIQDEQEAVVVHVDDAGEAEVVEHSEAEASARRTVLNVEMPAQEETEVGNEQTEVDNETGLTFEADGFSVYAVVVTEVIETLYIDANGDTYAIEVGYGEESGIPADATLEVSELTGEAAEAYAAQAAEALNVAADRVTYAKALDIAIVSGGERIQPAAPVSVSIRLLDAPEVGENENIDVVHFGDEPEALDCALEGETVAFESDGFSVYVVTFTLPAAQEGERGSDYYLQAGNSILLSQLLANLGSDVSIGDVSGVTPGNDSVLTVTPVSEGEEPPTDWQIASNDVSSDNINETLMITKADNGTIQINISVTQAETGVVTLTAASATKVYDGSALTDGKVTAEGLPEGYTFEATATGSQTDVGSSANVVNDGWVIKDNAEKDVTNTFKVNIVNGTLEVTGIPVTVTAENKTKAYGGKDPDYTAVVTGLPEDDTTTVFEYNFTRAVGENVGTYAITPTGEAVQGHYAVTYEPGTLTINKRRVNVTITGNHDTLAYDGQEHTVTGYTVTGDPVLETGEDANDVHIDYGKPGDYNEQVAAGYSATQDEVGTATMGLTKEVGFVNLNPNYTCEIDEVVDGYITITKRDDVEVTIVGNHNTDPITYDGTMHSVTGYQVVSVAYGGQTFNLNGNPAEGAALPIYTDSDFEFSGDDRVESVDAGTSYMGLRSSDFENTNDNFGKVTFTVTDGYIEIGPASVTVTITGNHEDKTYTGEEQSVTDYTAEHDSPLYDINDLYYGYKDEKTGQIVYYEAEAKGTDVKEADDGKYYMGLDKSRFYNANPNFTVTYAITDGFLKIEPAVLNVSIIGTQAEYPYDGKEHTAEGYTVEFDEEFSAYLDEDTDIHMLNEYEGEPVAARAARTNVGTDTMGLMPEWFECTNSNFDVIFSVQQDQDGSVTITPIEDEVVVYIKGNTKEVMYNGQLQSVEGYTVTGCNNDLYYNAADAANGLNFTFRGEAKAEGTDVGKHTMPLADSDFTNNNDNFSNVIFEIDEEGGWLMIDPKVVVTKQLINDLSTEDETFTFTATLTDEDGNPPAQTLILYEDDSDPDNVVVIQTGDNGTTNEFSLVTTYNQDTKRHNPASIELQVPFGYTLTVTEKTPDPDPNSYKYSYQIGDEPAETGNVAVLPWLDQNETTVIFRSDKPNCCRIDNMEFQTIKMAVEYARQNNSGNATIIEMLGNYTMLEGDIVQINDDLDIILTTAPEVEAELGTPARISRPADITDRALFAVAAGSKLTLGDTESSTGITLDGGSAGDTPITFAYPIIANSGTLVLNDGATLQNAHSTADGGAITNSGALEIKGGLLEGNHAANGGAIANSGTLEIKGGLIKDNQAPNSGAIFNAATGTLTVSGGSMTGNKALTTANGEDVYGLGGAIYNNGGSMTISGGVIGRESITDENAAEANVAQNGAAVYVASGTQNFFSGGKITGNIAATGAGDVGGAVGVANENVKLYFSGAPIIYDNYLQKDDTRADVCLDQDSHEVINAGALAAFVEQEGKTQEEMQQAYGPMIGVYVPVSMTALYNARGMSRGQFARYTDDGINASAFVNDHTPNMMVSMKYPKLVWGKPVVVEVRYLQTFDASNTTNLPPKAIGTEAKNLTFPRTGTDDEEYYPASSDNYAADIASDVLLTYKNSGGGASQIPTTAAFACAYAVSANQAEATGNEVSDQSFDKYITKLVWDNKNGNWMAKRKNYNADDENTYISDVRKIVIYYSMPTYITISNNADVNETDDNSGAALTINSLKLYTDSTHFIDAADEHEQFVGYGYIVAKNGATVQHFEPLTLLDFTMQKRTTYKLMFPGMRNKNYQISGMFTRQEEATGNITHSYMYNGRSTPDTGDLDGNTFTTTGKTYNSDASVDIQFGEGIKICKIGNRKYSSLKKAFKDAAEHWSDASWHDAENPNTIKIEMLRDYLIPDGDCVVSTDFENGVPEGFNVTLTTAEEYPTDNSEEEQFKNCAKISRDTGNKKSLIDIVGLTKNGQPDTTLTVENLRFDGKDVASDGEGGGVLKASSSAVTVNNIKCLNFEATNGGAIFVGNGGGDCSTLTVTNSYFENCNSSGKDRQGGGAIWTSAHTFTMSDSIFESCKSIKNTSSPGQGGAVFHRIDETYANRATTTSTVISCEFRNCEARGSGGALELNSYSITLTGTEAKPSKFVTCASKTKGGGGFNVFIQNQNVDVPAGSKATVNVSYCQFTNCSAAQDGGAFRTNMLGTLYEEGFDVTTEVQNSTFVENTATKTGGAIYTNIRGPVTLDGCTFRGNTANQYGGAVYSQVNPFTINGGTFVSNKAKTQAGGAIYAGNTLTINGATISGNTAATNGGGVYCANAMDITGATISGNTATSNGGGVYGASTTSITGTTISGNTATTNGGGVFSAAALSCANGTISNNTAGASGGGICCNASTTMNIDGGTISGNTAGTSGGGIYHSKDNGNNLYISGTVSITENKLTNDTPSNGAGVKYSGKLYFGKAGSEAADEITIKNNTTSQNKASNLWLGTAANVIVQNNLNGEIRVSNGAPHKPGYQFATATQEGFNGFDNVSDGEHVFYLDTYQGVWGVPDRADGTKIVWKPEWICKITKETGELLYIKLNNAFVPALFNDLGANTSIDYNCAFGVFKQTDFSKWNLYEKVGANYYTYPASKTEKKKFVVKMLAPEYTAQKYMTTDQNNTWSEIELTTAGTNEPDGYSYRGEPGTKSKIIRGTGIGANSLLTGKHDLTLSNIILDGAYDPVTNTGLCTVNGSILMTKQNSNAIITLEDGAILQNGCTASGKHGGGVYIDSNNGGKLVMKPGSVIRNCGAGGNGGGVAAYKNGVEMLGGTIEGCWASNGGGVYIESLYLKMIPSYTEGATNNPVAQIINCRATNGGGGVAIGSSNDNTRLTFSGNAVVSGNTMGEVGSQTKNNVQLNRNSDQIIRVGTGGIGANALIGVYVTDPHMYARGDNNCQFGTREREQDTNYLYRFVNDRNDLMGSREGQNKVKWRDIICLEVSNTASSDLSADLTKEYYFKVEVFKDNGATLCETIDGLYGAGDTGMLFDNGVAKLALKTGESRLAFDLLGEELGINTEAVTYKVTECTDAQCEHPLSQDANPDYTVTYRLNSATSDILGSETNSNLLETRNNITNKREVRIHRVAFTNTRKQADLTISKAVDSAVAQEDVPDFHYEVTLKHQNTQKIEDINKKFDVVYTKADGSTEEKTGDAGLEFKNGTASFTLSKEYVSIKIQGLPANIKYDVTQTSDRTTMNSFKSEYRVTPPDGSAYILGWRASDLTMQPGTDEVAFRIGPKVGSLKIVNQISSPVSSDKDIEFSYFVTINGKVDGTRELKDADGNKIRDITFMPASDGTRSLSEPFTVEGTGAGVTIVNLPMGVRYTVTQDLGDNADNFTPSPATNTRSASISEASSALFSNKRNTTNLTIRALVPESKLKREASLRHTFEIEVYEVDTEGKPKKDESGKPILAMPKVVVSGSQKNLLTAARLPVGFAYSVVETTNLTGLSESVCTSTYNEKPNNTGVIGQNTETVVFTSTRATGDLKIENELVSDYTADQSVMFTFKVKTGAAIGNYYYDLYNAKDNTPIAENQLISFTGSATASTTTGTLPLQGNQYAVIHGLPQGADKDSGSILQCTVTQTVKSDFETKVNGVLTYNATVALNVSNQPAAVKFTNTRKPGKLIISKTVSAANGSNKLYVDTNHSFRFTVNVPVSEGSKYNYRVVNSAGETVFDSADVDDKMLTFNADHKATLTLRDGEKATIEGLPINAEYSVTETQDKVGNTNVNLYNVNNPTYASNTITSTGRTAAFKNTHAKSALKVNNAVSSDIATDTSRNARYYFKIELYELVNDEQRAVVGTYNGVTFVASSVGDGGESVGVGTFSIVGNEPFKEIELPVGVHYTVTPVKNLSGDPLDGNSLFTAAVDPGSTATGTITTGNAASFTHTRKTDSLTVSKTVSSIFDADTTGENRPSFQFNVSIANIKDTPEDGGYSYSVYEGDDTEPKLMDTIRFSGGKTVSAITLQHDQRAIIAGLPKGASFTVTETAHDDFKAKASSIPGTIGQAAAAFENERKLGNLKLFKRVEKGIKADKKTQVYTFYVQLGSYETVDGQSVFEPNDIFAERAYTCSWSESGVRRSQSISFNDNAVGEITITGQGNRTLEGLPKGTVCKVWEQKLGSFEISITDNPESATVNEDTEGEPFVTLPISDSTQSVTFTNTRKSNGLTVTKTVGKRYSADQGYLYHFRITIPDEEEIGELQLVPADCVTYSENGLAEFDLTDGGTVTVQGLPSGVAYRIEELSYRNADDPVEKGKDPALRYATKVNGENVNVATGSISADGAASVEFNNTVAVCKITAEDAGLLYYGYVNSDDELDTTPVPAAFATLEDAFGVLNGQNRAVLYAYDKDSDAYEPYSDTEFNVEMLVSDYELKAALSLNSNDVTLTKADKSDRAFPYLDGDAPAVVTRGYTGGSMLTVGNATSPASLTLADVVLDGNKSGEKNYTCNANGGVVNVAAGSLTVESGAILRNSHTSAKGGAVYVASGASMAMTDGEITGNSATGGGAVDFAVAGSGETQAVLYLSGTPTIYNNLDANDAPKNIVLNVDSSEVIQVNGALKSTAVLGVYVDDSSDTTLMPKHGMRERPFATFTAGNDEHPEAFRNDRYSAFDDDGKYIGMEGTVKENATDDTFVWSGSLKIYVRELEDPSQMIKAGKAKLLLKKMVGDRWVTIWIGQTVEKSLTDTAYQVQIPWKSEETAVSETNLDNGARFVGGASFVVGSEYILEQTRTDDEHTLPTGTWKLTVKEDNTLEFTQTDSTNPTTPAITLSEDSTNIDLRYDLFNARVQSYRIEKYWKDEKGDVIDPQDPRYERLKDLDITFQLYRVSTSSGIESATNATIPPVETRMSDSDISTVFNEWLWIENPLPGQTNPDIHLNPGNNQVGFMPLTINGVTKWYIVLASRQNTREEFLKPDVNGVSQYANNNDFLAFSGRILIENQDFSAVNNGQQVQISNTDKYGTFFKRGDILACANGLWVYRNHGDETPQYPPNGGNIWYRLGDLPTGGENDDPPVIKYNTQEIALGEATLQTSEGFTVVTVDSAKLTSDAVENGPYHINHSDTWRKSFMDLEGGKNVYYYAVETGVLDEDVTDLEGAAVQKYNPTYEYDQTGDSVKIYNTIPDFVARVRTKTKDENNKWVWSDWSYHTTLIHDSTDTTVTGVKRGAFNVANAVEAESDVEIELLKESHAEYQLARGFAFNNANIKSLTIKATDGLASATLVASSAEAANHNGIENSDSLIRSSVNTEILNVNFENSGTAMRALYMEGQQNAEKTLKVASSTFRNFNASNSNGGALYLAGYTTTSFGGTITNCSAANGGAIYADSGATLELTVMTGEDNDVPAYATINGNSASTAGAGVYLAQGSTLKLSGRPSFGGADLKGGSGDDKDNILGTSGNFLTTTLSGKANGDKSYTKPRQDVYLAGYGTPLASITVTGALDVEPGSIWVWAENENHYKYDKQFAVFADDLMTTVDSAQKVNLDDAPLEKTLKAFRNAQTDDVTECKGDYLFGAQKDEFPAQIFWGSSGVEVSFKKVNGFGQPIANALFTLYRQYSYAGATATAPVTQTLTEATGISASSTASDTSDNVVFTKDDKPMLVPAGVYYMIEKVPEPQQPGDPDYEKTTDDAASPKIYTKESATSTAEDETANGKLRTGYSPTVHVLLVGPAALKVPDDKEGTLWEDGGVLKNITQDDINAQLANGADQPWKQFAIFRIDPTTGQAVANPDIAGHGILNVSSKSRKVILRKVIEDTYMAKSGVNFNLYAYDGRLIEEGLQSQASGVSYIGTLPYGLYYLAEAAAGSDPALAAEGEDSVSYFRFGVDDRGVFEWSATSDRNYTNELNLKPGSAINQPRPTPAPTPTPEPTPVPPERKWVFTCNPDQETYQRGQVVHFALKDEANNITVGEGKLSLDVDLDDAQLNSGGGIVLSQYGTVTVTVSLDNTSGIQNWHPDEQKPSHRFTFNVPRPDPRWDKVFSVKDGDVYVGDSFADIVNSIVFTESAIKPNGSDTVISYSDNPGAFNISVESNSTGAYDANTGEFTQAGQVTFTVSLNASALDNTGLTPKEINAADSVTQTVTVSERPVVRSWSVKAFRNGTEVTQCNSGEAVTLVLSESTTSTSVSSATGALDVTVNGQAITPNQDGTITLNTAGEVTIGARLNDSSAVANSGLTEADIPTEYVTTTITVVEQSTRNWQMVVRDAQGTLIEGEHTYSLNDAVDIGFKDGNTEVWFSEHSDKFTLGSNSYVDNSSGTPHIKLTSTGSIEFTAALNDISWIQGYSNDETKPSGTFSFTVNSSSQTEANWVATVTEGYAKDKYCVGDIIQITLTDTTTNRSVSTNEYEGVFRIEEPDNCIEYNNNKNGIKLVKSKDPARIKVILTGVGGIDGFTSSDVNAEAVCVIKINKAERVWSVTVNNHTGNNFNVGDSFYVTLNESKTGTSVNSQNNAWALNINSQDEGVVFDNGKITVTRSGTKHINVKLTSIYASGVTGLLQDDLEDAIAVLTINVN